MTVATRNPRLKLLVVRVAQPRGEAARLPVMPQSLPAHAPSVAGWSAERLVPNVQGITLEGRRFSIYLVLAGNIRRREAANSRSIIPCCEPGQQCTVVVTAGWRRVRRSP